MHTSSAEGYAYATRRAISFFSVLFGEFMLGEFCLCVEFSGSRAEENQLREINFFLLLLN
jgi:hypothetical protein